MKLFKNFKEWKDYTLSAVKDILIGLLRIVWSLIKGLISLIAFLFSSISSFCKREPIAMLVMSVILACILLCLIFTFVNERSMRVNAESQRDSISLKLDSARQNSLVTEYSNVEWNGN